MHRACFRPADPAAQLLPPAAAALLAALVASLCGCASPGPPRAPSLQLPQPVKDLAVKRLGPSVELTFTVPQRTTDKQPLQAPELRGTLCRELENQGCVAVAGLTSAISTAGQPSTLTLHDELPPSLLSGPPRLLSYRVEYFNRSGRSAGASDAAYTVAGAAPLPVEDLSAAGSRQGIVLRWRAAPGQSAGVLLRRQDTSTPHAPTPASAPTQTRKPARQERSRQAAEAGVVWLDTHDDSPKGVPETLDATARPEVAYLYAALRETTVNLGGRSLSLRSQLSPAIGFTLHDVFPPPVPTGLNAIGFTGDSASYAVDLIWQPVQDEQLAGYNVYRRALQSPGEDGSARMRLNATPVLLPSFHDARAKPGTRYRYEVTAIDAKGNESEPGATTLEPGP
jgi:hypothetical protein